MAFSLSRARFLLNQTYKVRELDTVLKVCRHQRVNDKQIIYKDSLTKVDLQKVHKNDLEALALKETKIGLLEAEKQAERRKTRVQKVQKWAAIIMLPVAFYGGFRAAILLQ